MTTPAVRPFPWSSLSRAQAADPRWLAAARSALLPQSVVGDCLEALAGLVGCPVTAELVSIGLVDATPIVGDTLRLRLAFPGGAASWSLMLEVEAPLMVGLVARATRRPPPRVVRPGLGSPLSPALAGAFGAVLATAIRRAAGPTLVLDVPSAPHTTTDDTVHAVLSVRVDGEASVVRATVPRAMLTRIEDAVRAAHALAADAVPIEVPVVACCTLASASEVASLRVGDAWMLGDAWKSGGFVPTRAGPGGDPPAPRNVWLCHEQASLAFAASLEPDGRVVLRQGFEELGWSPMPDANETPTLIEAIGEVPVVIRVELGAARMRAREWAALVPGDVIGMGSKVGSKVTLRVSGLAVAEGELVDIDGELGVRIRRRLGEK